MSFADQAVQALDRLSSVILDDVGDGPRPSDLAAAAKTAREAVAQLAVPALTQLGGLIAGVADAVVTGATEWNPGLGGTLMAAVDDLRHLATRPFNDEDAEHLAHRASELAPFVGTLGRGDVGTWGRGDVGTLEAAMADSARSAISSAPTSPSPTSPRPHVPTSQSPHAPTPSIIPISDLFYADGGPHIVSGGTPPEAAKRSDLLGQGIDALDNLTMKPIARQVTFGAIEVVPVETLLYRGRAALERAAAIREQIKQAGGVASAATLEEMYDLIGLALKD